MTRVVADISMSLDGFVTGPNPGPDNGLGDGGEALHTWAFSDDPVDQRLVAQATARSGAVPRLGVLRMRGRCGGEGEQGRAAEHQESDHPTTGSLHALHLRASCRRTV